MRITIPTYKLLIDAQKKVATHYFLFLNFRKALTAPLGKRRFDFEEKTKTHVSLKRAYSNPKAATYSPRACWPSHKGLKTRQ